MADTAHSKILVPISYKTRLDERLKVVLDGMPVGVTWARLEDGSIQYMNRRFLQMLGYTLEELPTVFDFFERCLALPEQREAAMAATRALIGKDHLAEIEIPSFEVELLCKDGTCKTVAFGGTVLPDTGWMVATFLDLSDRKERERLIERLAEEDPLTGLLNRRSFDAVLEAALANIEPGRMVHLILLDLDGFKQVNDRFGHEAGDRVLRQIASELGKALRRDDNLARIGGDEFAAILSAPDGGERIDDILRRVHEVFAAPFEVDGEAVWLGVSAGVARFPDEAHDALQLYKSADRAMYTAKARRKTGLGMG